MTATQDAELQIVSALLRHSKTLRASRPPELAIAAANWEIFFQSKLAELEAKAGVSLPVDLSGPDHPPRTGTHG